MHPQQSVKLHICICKHASPFGNHAHTSGFESFFCMEHDLPEVEHDWNIIVELRHDLGHDMGHDLFLGHDFGT
jgi:predicted nucleic acid binding AN1-type Zn finger protein